jgi:hypothetical protein
LGTPCLDGCERRRGGAPDELVTAGLAVNVPTPAAHILGFAVITRKSDLNSWVFNNGWWWLAKLSEQLGDDFRAIAYVLRWLIRFAVHQIRVRWAVSGAAPVGGDDDRRARQANDDSIGSSVHRVAERQ